MTGATFGDLIIRAGDDATTAIVDYARRVEGGVKRKNKIMTDDTCARDERVVVVVNFCAHAQKSTLWNSPVRGRVEFDSLGIGERDHHLRNGALGGHHGTGLSAYGERTETSGVEIGSELAAVLTLRGEIDAQAF